MQSKKLNMNNSNFMIYLLIFNALLFDLLSTQTIEMEILEEPIPKMNTFLSCFSPFESDTKIVMNTFVTFNGCSKSAPPVKRNPQGPDPVRDNLISKTISNFALIDVATLSILNSEIGLFSIDLCFFFIFLFFLLDVLYSYNGCCQ